MVFIYIMIKNLYVLAYRRVLVEVLSYVLWKWIQTSCLVAMFAYNIVCIDLQVSHAWNLIEKVLKNIL